MNAAGGEAVHAPDNVAGWLVLVCAYSDEIVFQTAYRYGSAEGLISAQRAHHNFFRGVAALGVDYPTDGAWNRIPYCEKRS